MHLDRRLLPALVVAATACTVAEADPVRTTVETGEPRVSVEIIRDEFGVPHVYGPTDASVIFGEAWAEAEDNWWQVEDNFVRSIGRAAELYGPDAVMDDYVARAMEIERLSREEYETATPEMKVLYDAYAAGFNAWLDRNPAVERRLLDRVEPWYAIALLRFKYHHNEYIGYAGLRSSDMAVLLRGARVDEGSGSEGEPFGEASPSTGGASTATGGDTSGFESALALAGREWPGGERPLGSNEWAVSGSRTASGHAMLLINPHVPFFGLSQYTEIHLESEEGLEFSGLSRFGFMFPYMGNSRRLGWAYTDNYADIGDLYFETFEYRDGAFHYRYGEEWRPVETWTETIRVRADGGMEDREYRFSKTHHGPILGMRRDPDRPGQRRPLAVRVAKLEEGRWYDQWYDMMRARDLEAWRAAVSRLAVPYQNTMYADVDGNIFYLYNSAVPRRSLVYDWSQPVDGADPGTEWDGYHELGELPQYLNPSTGYLQNTNSTPFMATEGLGDGRENYPPYMVGGEDDNYRALSSRRLLSALQEITLDDFARAATDSRLSAADELLPQLFEEFDRLEVEEPVSTSELRDAVDLLRDWDRLAGVDSEATTVFVRWADPYMRARGSDSRWPATSTLRRVLEVLDEEWGRWRVAWGELNRLQRPDASGQAPFSDEAASLPVPAGPGWLGSVFTYSARRAPDGIRQYGVHGNSFVKVIEFAPEPRARSILTFGQSGHADSPHYFDQAPIYVSKGFKPAWMSRAEVEAHAERSYRVEMP